MEYYSDKELGSKARIESHIEPRVWAGIVAHIASLITIGAFGEHFPEMCPNGTGPIGTDALSFSQALKAEIPGVEWPLKITEYQEQEDYFLEKEPYAPDTVVALDIIQFCYMHVAKPIQDRDSYHDFFKHYHLSFDSETGQLEFKKKINRIFSRNGLGYELDENGSIKRLSSPVIGEQFESMRFDTKDRKLNKILEDARNKYLSSNPSVHQKAIERLWDAWERLKTLENPSNKKNSITQILDKAASETKFRELLEAEAVKLTNIGNTFHIRHSEVTQTEIERMEHFDYLFHRLLSMIFLILPNTTGGV
jgi:hypothetical protein